MPSAPFGWSCALVMRTGHAEGLGESIHRTLFGMPEGLGMTKLPRNRWQGRTKLQPEALSTSSLITRISAGAASMLGCDRRCLCEDSSGLSDFAGTGDGVRQRRFTSRGG